MSKSELTISPKTLLIEGLPSGALTADQFGQLIPPPCPVCGATVRIDRIDVTLNAEEEARRGRSYIAGRWECPHDCDPRAGQRRHYGQSYGRGVGDPGVTCKCSCGDETIAVSQEEHDAWRAVHHPPLRQ